MKKIRNILFALPLALTLIACSDDDIATTPATTNPLDELGAVTGTTASIEEFIAGPGDDDPIRSKSKVYYDRLSNLMKFEWESEDLIGIFAQDNDKGQFAFKLDDEVEPVVSGTSVTGAFVPSDEDVPPIVANQLYYSYIPYIEKTIETGDFAYNQIPITFRGQTQRANDKMNLYWQARNDEFLESEKAAAAHLASYDYRVANATATAGNHVHFHYKGITSVVRFYMFSPKAANPGLFIDSLQVVNNSKKFVLDGTISLNSPFDEYGVPRINPTKESHAISLVFNPAIDMTNNSDNTKETYDYWDQEYPVDGYIMAYMKIAPINLTGDAVSNSTLYLVAKEPTYYANVTEYNAYYGAELTTEQFAALKQAEKMKVYKDVDAYNTAKGTSLSAEDFAALPVDKRLIDPIRRFYQATLSKMNFLAAKHYQWVPAINPDQPIKFEEITIQEWKEGVNYTNNGAGTGDW